MSDGFAVVPIGVVSSALTDPAAAPKQGVEGGPAARIVLAPEWIDAAADISVGDRLVVLTWLHLADRRTVRVHPRDDPAAPLRGVFSTRSADRPNPVGLHEVTVLEVADGQLRVSDLEAVDGTPVIDLKPVLRGGA